MATRVLSQYDYGQTFEITVIDANGTVVPINSDTITAYVVYPDGVEHAVDPANLTIIDNLNGKVRIKLAEGFVDQEGLHSIYVSLKGADYEVNTTNAIYYYSQAKHGGAGVNN